MKVNKIIIHCSATPEGEDFTVKDIDRWHRHRGFQGIGYHWVVYRDGSIHAGRPETSNGAHCTGQNSQAIGICYIGGCAPRTVKNWNKVAKDTRTPEQKAALKKLVADIRHRYKSPLPVYGHRDFAPKPCPSFNAKAENWD